MIDDPTGSQIRFSRLQGALFSVPVFRIEQGGGLVHGPIIPRLGRRFHAILNPWKTGTGGTPSGVCCTYTALTGVFFKGAFPLTP